MDRVIRFRSVLSGLSSIHSNACLGVLPSYCLPAVAILTEKQTSFAPSDSKLPVVLTTGQTPLHSFSSFETTGLTSWSGVSRSSSNIVDHDVNPRAHQSSATCSNTAAVSTGKMSISETHVSYEQVCYSNFLCSFFLFLDGFIRNVLIVCYSETNK